MAKVRVIKLGGSLLDWPELPVRFQRWLAAQPPARSILMVGGGTLVDALRELDTIHRLPAETMHWLAIDAMRVTARLAAALLPKAMLVESLAAIEWDRRPNNSLAILDVARFMQNEESHIPGTPLPRDWTATSDSIAARVAVAAGACDLVLLKSAPLPGELEVAASPEALARAGLVDPCFARAARTISVRYVDLRGNDWAGPISSVR